MAGGPVLPDSEAYPDTGYIYPSMLVGGTNSRQWYCAIVIASLAGDAILSLEFPMPKVLPSGTPKLEVETRSNATSGSCNINPAWASIAAGENYDTFSLNAEGNTNIAYGAGDNDDRKITKITLDADTVVAGETIRMHVTFVSSGFTFTNVTGWKFRIIWE